MPEEILKAVRVGTVLQKFDGIVVGDLFWRLVARTMAQQHAA